jgi:hypothetical protein
MYLSYTDYTVHTLVPSRYAIRNGRPKQLPPFPGLHTFPFRQPFLFNIFKLLHYIFQRSPRWRSG